MTFLLIALALVLLYGASVSPNPQASSPNPGTAPPTSKAGGIESGQATTMPPDPGMGTPSSPPSTPQPLSQPPTTQPQQAQLPSNPLSSAQPQSQQQPITQSGLLQNLGQMFGSQFQSEDQAMAFVRNLVQQAAQYQNVYQTVAPHWSQIQQGIKNNWQTAQHQQQQPTQQGPDMSWWGVPEYNPEWINWVEKDAQGNLRTKLNYPPDTVHKLQAYWDWQQKKSQEFFKNPIETLAPGIKQMIAPLVQQMIQGQFTQTRNQQAANQIIDQNQNWMFERDPKTNQFFTDPVSGKRYFSKEGEIYFRKTQELAQLGIQDAAYIHDQAFNYMMGQRYIDAWRQQQQQASQQQALPNAQLPLQQGQPFNYPQAQAQQQFNQPQWPQPQVPAPNPQGWNQAQQPIPQTPPQGGANHMPTMGNFQQFQTPTNPDGQMPMSLAQRILQHFDANGVTDAVINQSLSRNGTR